MTAVAHFIDGVCVLPLAAGPWALGWNALASIFTVALAITTGALAWQTRSVAKETTTLAAETGQLAAQTTDEIAESWRPILVSGLAEWRVTFEPPTTDLPRPATCRISLLNCGRGAALDLKLGFYSVPRYDYMGFAGGLVSPGLIADREVSYEFTTNAQTENLSIISGEVVVAYRDVIGRTHATSFGVQARVSINLNEAMHLDVRELRVLEPSTLTPFEFLLKYEPGEWPRGEADPYAQPPLADVGIST